ncbi:MAG TPA: hypothetical protein PLT65_04355 [Bacilli bacterium]|nr:hypothetical protein [Bacilli bacterium]
MKTKFLILILTLLILVTGVTGYNLTIDKVYDRARQELNTYTLYITENLTTNIYNDGAVREYSATTNFYNIANITPSNLSVVEKVTGRYYNNLGSPPGENNRWANIYLEYFYNDSTTSTTETLQTYENSYQNFELYNPNMTKSVNYIKVWLKCSCTAACDCRETDLNVTGYTNIIPNIIYNSTQKTNNLSSPGIYAFIYTNNITSNSTPINFTNTTYMTTNVTNLYTTIINLGVYNVLTNSLLTNINYIITHIVSGLIINGFTATGTDNIKWVTGSTSVNVYGDDIVEKTGLTTFYNGLNYYNISTYPGQVVLLQTRDMFTNALINNVSLNLSGSATYNWLINGTQNYTGVTAGGYNVQIGKSGYTNFTDTFTVSRTALVNKTYYLSTNGQNTIFYVKNIYDQFLEGATVNISRSSDQALLYSKTTDGVGSVLFVLDPSITYLVTVTMNGYNPYSGIITPSTNSFTITLGTPQTTIPDYYSGILNTFTPTTNLQNNTNYNFTAEYTSESWNITNCYLTILDKTNNVLNTTTFTTCEENEGEGLINFNTNNYTYLQLISTYTINATNTTDNTTYLQNISYKKSYGVYSYYEGDYSLMNAIRNTKNFNGSGFGDSERIMIAFIIIFSIAIAAMRRSVNKYVNSGNLLILIALLVFTMSYLELMTLNFIPGSGVVNNVMNQYGVSILIGLLAILTAIFNREEEK